MLSSNHRLPLRQTTPLRRMAKHTPRTRSRQRQQRQRRASTPSTPIERVKQPTTAVEAKRQHMKKQKVKEHRRRRADAARAAAQRIRRERWGAIGLETQNIVLGDGQYVEERPVPSVPSLMTQSPDAQTNPPSVPVSVQHNIAAPIVLSQQRTIYYDHRSKALGPWKDSHPISPLPPVQIEFSSKSTLTIARQLALSRSNDPLRSTDVGILSCASSKRTDAHLKGSSEQEDVLIRHSSLLACLGSPAGREFYTFHRAWRNKDGSGLQDHAMLYSPGVVVFRKDGDDEHLDESSLSLLSRIERDSLGGEFIPPYSVDVVSAVPVNAATVRVKHVILPGEESFFENGIRDSMKERMGRVLRAFELHGDKVLVLGAFGCGSYENKVETVARIWAELLVCGETVGNVKTEPRFKSSFEKVVFAVPGKLFEPFKKAFELRLLEEQLTSATLEP
ncbi:hypothetical protein C8Q80DRAFT_1203828 [Daedaleopsis nitida]|nr:hypothetical protein C8Q80DRAFT_1203828 [Daedaleopsis nitida]